MSSKVSIDKNGNGNNPLSNTNTTAAPELQQPKKKKNFLRGHAGGAMLSGVFEIALFHPFDTIAKRLMSHTGRVTADGALMVHLNNVIFKQHADAPVLKKVMFLYPGSLFAVAYRVVQRVYKFAGQPAVKSALQRCDGLRTVLDRWCGTKAQMMTEAIAGSLIGMGEVALLPLDRLKVLSQTNEAALAGKKSIIGITSILRSYGGLSLHAGAVVTLCRNAPGSFCLFGGAAFTKDVIFGLEDYRSASFTQNIAAATIGSCLSITVTSPMDVVKTRIQSKPFGETHNGRRVFCEMIKNESCGAFFKGLVPKLATSAPKLVFAYTMTEYFTKMLTKKNEKKI